MATVRRNSSCQNNTSRSSSGRANPDLPLAPHTVIQRAVHIHPTVAELIPTMLGELNRWSRRSATTIRDVAVRDRMVTPRSRVRLGRTDGAT